MMRVKYNLNVHKQDKKCTLTDVIYIQFIGEFLWEINSVGKTCPTVSLMPWMPCIRMHVVGFMYLTSFSLR